LKVEPVNLDFFGSTGVLELHSNWLTFRLSNSIDLWEYNFDVLLLSGYPHDEPVGLFISDDPFMTFACTLVVRCAWLKREVQSFLLGEV